MARGGSFFEGVIFGAAIGAITALLLAPQTGRELRSKLKEVCDDCSCDSCCESDETAEASKKDTVETLIVKTRDAIETGFDRLTKMMDDRKKPADPSASA